MFSSLQEIELTTHKTNKEHVQLRFGVQKYPYFENTGPDWNKLGSFEDKHHILHNF